MTETVALDKIHTDRSLYSADVVLNQPNKERMEKHIIEDLLKPKEAAKRIGLSVARFNRLYATDEMFRNWVDGCTNERNGRLMEELVNTIRDVLDPSQRAKLLFDLKKHLDKEFGMQVVKTEELKISASVSPEGRKRIDSVLEASSMRITDESESDKNS